MLMQELVLVILFAFVSSKVVFTDFNKYATNNVINSTTDFNECVTNNGNCGQICTNTVGSFTCSCYSGYMLNADARTCSGNSFSIGMV